MTDSTRDAQLRTVLTAGDRLDDITRARMWSGIADQLAESTAAAAAPRSRWTRNATIACGALAIAATALLVVRAGRGKTGELGAAPGQLAVAADATLSTRLGPHARAALVGPARLEMLGPAGEVTVVRLHEGTLLAEFEGGAGRALRIEAGDLTAEVVGTLFSVEIMPSGACVSVAHGAVRVTSHGASHIVGAQQQLCSGDAAPHALPANVGDQLTRHEKTIELALATPTPDPTRTPNPDRAPTPRSTATAGTGPSSPPVSTTRTDGTRSPPTAANTTPNRSPSTTDDMTSATSGTPPGGARSPSRPDSSAIAPPGRTTVPTTPRTRVAISTPAPPPTTTTPRVAISTPAAPPTTTSRVAISTPAAPSPTTTPRVAISTPAAPSTATAPRVGTTASGPSDPASGIATAPSSPMTGEQPTAESLYRAAEAALAAGDRVRADRELARLLALPGAALADQALYERARIAYQRRDAKAARAHLASLAAISGSPLAEPGHYLDCRIAVESKAADAERCFTAYRASYPRSPHDLDVLAVLAQLAHARGSCTAARPLRDELLAKYPRSDHALVWRSRCTEAP
jgi:TolA-binding protein